jgi:hypothetical protein
MKKVTDLKVIIFWKTTIIILGSLALLTCFVRISGFWSSYVLDIAGPAWIYILLRGQYTSKQSGFLSFKFSPEMAASLILGICFVIETSQYFKLYVAHFDPYDYIAYVSLLLPFFLIDKFFVRKGRNL